jgi:hypothetical protein
MALDHGNRMKHNPTQAHYCSWQKRGVALEAQPQNGGRLRLFTVYYSTADLDADERGHLLKHVRASVNTG